MILRQTLNKAIAELRRARIESPILDAEVLLAYATGFSKEKIIAYPETKLTSAQKRRFFSLTRRRKKHEPVAYITGHKEFYGLDFLVNKNVLIPRPETEMLIEVVQDCFASLAMTKKANLVITDVGTGSGAIAVTLAKLLPRTKVFATDISSGALKVARKNTKRHKVKIKFTKADLLSTLTLTLPHRGGGKSIIITANLPYLPTHEWRATQPEIKKFEPRISLDGGKDGLKCYRGLLQQLYNLTNQSLRGAKATKQSKIATLAPLARNDIHVFLEFDPEQTKALKKLVLKYFPKAKIEIKKDLAGRNRVAVIRLGFFKS